MISKMNEHYSMTNPASVYDEEALTSLELAGRTTAKLNECVERVNAQDDDIKNQKEVVIPATITAEVQKYIDEGQFDKAIDLYAGELEARLNNLLNSTPEGSTTMDTEVIDARLGQDGTNYQNLGTAIRSQFLKAMKHIVTDITDANEMTENGIYFRGSSTVWTNTPSSLGTAVCILTFGDPSSNMRKIQLLFDYEMNCYFRKYDSKIGGMGSWERIVTNTFLESWWNAKNQNVMLGVYLDKTVEHDFNDFTESGFYFFGSGTPMVNNPTVAGVLVVYRSSEGDHLHYQMCYTHDGLVFYRNNKFGVGWLEWKQLAFVDPSLDLDTLGEKEYTIMKVNDERFYIYKKGVNGYIRYTYAKQVNTNINLNTWRLYDIYLCDSNKTPLTPISDAGADLDGVVLLDGESDHIGGIHGDEQASEYFLFVDGKQYTFESIVNMECSEIKIIVNSTITHQDSTNVCMNKNKQTTFDKDGVHMNLCWEALEVFKIDSIRSCMFSIEKDCFTHYFDSTVNRTPLERNADDTATSRISEDSNMTDIFYVGRVTAHHWTGKRGGDTSGHSTLVNDYGTRYKSYFNCYDGHTTTVGEKLYAENHFNISC